MEEVIKMINISKRYGKTNVVNEISLSVREGEILGFLGLNGAGKTTTMRMLLGLVKPTSGECYLQGKRVEINNLDIWNNVGYIIETPYSYPNLTVRENLEIVLALRGIKDKSRIDWIIEKIKIKEYENKKAKHLSLGNLARLGIAKAIIHKPKILILDEPTNGLDPSGIIEVRELLKELVHELGTTILISSHKLEELSKIVNRIAIIHHGRLIKEIQRDELEANLEKKLLVAGDDNKSIQKILLENGYEIDFKLDSKSDQSYLRLIDKKAVEHPENIATLLVKNGCPPKLLSVEKEDLEKYFFRMLKNYDGGNK